MFTPLPLRLCCLAAMAPALTEAASQAQNFKLPHSSSDSQNTPVVVNGRTCQGPEPPNLINSCSGIARTSILNKATITSLPHKDLINLVTKDTVEVKSLGINNSLNNTKTHFGPLSSLPGLLKKEILIKKANSNGSTIPFSINTNNSLSHQLTTMNKGSNSNINGMDKNKGSMGLLKSNDSSSINGGQTSGYSNAPSPANINSEQKGEISAFQGNGTNKTKSNGEENAKNLTSGMVICSEVSKRQAHLERKADRAMRRLRKLQIRQAQVHVREQLIAFLEHQRKTLQSLSRNTKISTPTSNCSAVEFKTELLQSEDVKNLSTAALVNLVRKLESTHGSALRQKLSSSGNKSSDRSEGGYIIKLNEDMCKEMKRAASTLECNLRHLERAIDSDATESSSGGESCDELEGYDDTKTNHTPIHRRGMWKWAVERTGVASRWTWLQAQVSDLEYRIRQQSDIYRQIRATKGCVVLGEAPTPEELLKQRIPNRTVKKLSPIEAKIANLEQRNEMSPSSLSTLLSNVDKQNVHLTSTSMACFTPVNNGKKQPNLQTSKLVNGFIDSNNSNGSHGNHNKVDSSECDLDSSSKKSCTDIISGIQPPVVDTTCQAARVRPLKSFRKRKLFRPAGLHLVSRKAAKLSTLKCGCAPPFTPCAMCGGRYNNTQSLDPDIMSREERVAHLDASFHPVLSFPQDIPLPIHFEALLKSGEWQNKSPPKPVPNIKKKPKLFSPLSEHARKHSKKLARSAAATLLSTARLRKFGEKSLTKGHGNSIVSIPKNSLSESRMIKSEFRNKRTATQMAIAAFSKRHRSLSLSSNSSNPATPSPTPISLENSSGSGILSHHQSGPNYIGHSTTFREMMRRRRGESAFDINNIVIPYSMAASTRVEKLQYKEIITPKWRVIDDDEDVENVVADENDDQTKDNNGISIEDLSDEAYTTRHQTCEIEEKKRFMTYVQHNKRGTIRGSRTDSGANSPDIFSSHESYNDSYPSGGISSPLTPPPSTGGKGEESHPTRRRSGSFCRQHRLSDDHRNTPDITEDVTYIYVPPFDLRTFPLSEEDYQHLLEQPNTDIPKIEKRLGGPCSLTESRPSSPISSTSGSVVDDPNDPEWTVVTAEKAKEGKPAIVLKISKR